MPKRSADAMTHYTPARARKSYKSSGWRSSYRSRSSFYRPLSQVGSGFGRAYSTGFPKMLRMKHKYVSTVTIGNGGGAFKYWNFSCNGMYGPEGTFAGHQPYYFDQLATIYDHYTVVGSKIKFTMNHLGKPAGASLDNAVRLGTCISDAGVEIGNMTLVQERPSGKAILLGPADSGTGQKTVTMKWSARQAFGSAAISDPNLQGTAASNPTEQQWFYIELEPNAAEDPDAVTITAEIEYIAVWQELKSVATS